MYERCVILSVISERQGNDLEYNWQERKRMDNIRMVALDLDGTTLDSQRRFSPRTIEAFRRAMERGVHIVISTGRVWCSLPSQMFDIEGLEYVITSNGASVTRLPEKERIFEKNLDPDAVRQVVDLVRNRDFSVDGFTDGQAYIDAAEYEDIQRNGSTYRDAEYVLSTRKPVDNIYDFILQNRDHIENISLNFRTDEEKDAFRPEIEAVPGITLTSSWHNNFEIGGPDTSKADALHYLMGRLDIHKSQLMACGDSPNDLKMMKLAGIGVAMGNASDAMKKEADYVTDTNNEDGVAKAIERFVLRQDSK